MSQIIVIHVTLIRSSCQERDLIILIDSDNTHNFIDEYIINEIKIVIERIVILAIIVANRNVIRCNAHSPRFIWFMQGYEFQTYLRILKLGRCDMVLKVDWLSIYLAILLNFIKIKLLFKKNGRMIGLKGIVEEARL